MPQPVRPTLLAASYTLHLKYVILSAFLLLSNYLIYCFTSYENNVSVRESQMFNHLAFSFQYVFTGRLIKICTPKIIRLRVCHYVKH